MTANGRSEKQTAAVAGTPPSAGVVTPAQVVEWVHAFDDTDCFDGSVERDGRYAGTYWCGDGREVRMTGETAPARGDQ